MVVADGTGFVGTGLGADVGNGSAARLPAARVSAGRGAPDACVVVLVAIGTLVALGGTVGGDGGTMGDAHEARIRIKLSKNRYFIFPFLGMADSYGNNPIRSLAQ